MADPTRKDLNRFKITLLILPIIPCLILYFKNHIQAAGIVLSFCWIILLISIILNFIKKGTDKYIYNFIHKILKITGIILSTIALIFVWIFTIFPTGIIAKIVKRDRLSLQKKNKLSYWKDFDKKEVTYENQY